MLTYIGRRILYSVPVLAVASFILFWGVRLTFDPTAKYRTSKDAARIIAEKRHELGLDRPIIAQWWTWITHFVRGDWGISSSTNGRVSDMTFRALGFTMQLIFWGILISLIIAIGVGVLSAVRQYSLPDYIFTGLSYLGIAMPVFWFALMANQFLAIWPKDTFNLSEPPLFFVGLHSTGQSGINLDYFRHLALPVLALTVQIIAVWSRFQRASMLDVLSADYVRTARAKGLPPRTVIFKHALRNALLPLVSQSAVDIGALFGGLLITEQIYSIPGMGRLFLGGLQTGDVNVVLAWMMVSAVFVILFNLIADVIYGFLDPAGEARVTTYEDKIPPAEQVAPTTQFPEPVVFDEEIGDFELVAGAEPEPRTQWQLFWHRFFRHKLAVFALFTLGVIFVLCFGASWIAPYAKNHQDLLTPVTGPSWSHLFGVDQLGRDYFSEVLYAGQISLKIGIAVGLISTVIGFISGAIAGYFGRSIDNILMRVTDLFLVVPAIAILAIALQQFGYSDLTIIFVLAGLFWMSVARVVRSQVLSLREKEFVEAARAAGATNNRIVVRHILPNMIGPLMVNATLSIAAAILTEATLSFLGFGVQPPKSSWGNMLTQAEGTVGTSKVYLLYFPGIMLLLVVICINFLGDGIRDAFDPQTKH